MLESPLGVLLPKAHVRRLRATLVAHVLLAGGVLGLSAYNTPALRVVCAVTWVCIILAPAAGIEVWLRALDRPERRSTTLRRMLTAPLVVGWLALISLVEVMTRHL